MEPLEAEIYVDTIESLHSLALTIAAAVPARILGTELVGDGWRLDVRRNSTGKPEGQRYEPAPYLEFPTVVEIDAASGDVSLDAFIELISAVMLALAANGNPLSTVSSWDDKLPGRAHLGY